MEDSRLETRVKILNRLSKAHTEKETDETHLRHKERQHIEMKEFLKGMHTGEKVDCD